MLFNCVRVPLPLNLGQNSHNSWTTDFTSLSSLTYINENYKESVAQKIWKKYQKLFFYFDRPMNHTEQTTYNSATGSLKVYCQAKASLTDCEHYKIISHDGKYDTNIRYKFNDSYS